MVRCVVYFDFGDFIMKTNENHIIFHSSLKLFSGPGWAVLLVITLAGLNGCASLNAPSKNFKGSHTALLDWSAWGAGQVLAIDGNAPGKENRIELQPGNHEIRYGGRRGSSFLLNPRMKDEYDYSASINMRAGHHYVVQHERTYKYRGYRDFFWIEDLTSGEVVAGSFPAHEKEIEARSEQAKVKRTIEDHFQRLLESAECGNPDAQYDLGTYYLAGIRPVGKRDNVRAWVFYRMAASKGHPNAGDVATRIYRDLNQEQIANAETELAQFKPTPCRSSPETNETQKAGERQ